VHLLFEHQSTPDAAMPVRLHGYVHEILARHHRRHGYPLPCVVPFVLNQGPDPWRHPTRFGEHFPLPSEAGGAMARFVPDFEYLVLDLAVLDPRREEHDELMRVVLQLAKAARIGGQVEFLGEVVRDLAGGRIESIRPVLIGGGVFGDMYVYVAKITPDLDPEELHGIVALDPQAEQTAMTVA